MSDDDHAQSPGAVTGVVEVGVADPIDRYCLQQDIMSFTEY